VGDVLIGLSFLVVSVIGAKESWSSLEEEESSCPPNELERVDTPPPLNEATMNAAGDSLITTVHEEYKLSSTPAQVNCSTRLLAVLMSGTLLGFSWDGLPSLAPVLSADSSDEFYAFVGAYWIGTVCAMSILCMIVGELTVWLGKTINSNLPAKLSLASSLIAGLTGLFWISQTVFRMLVVGKNVRSARDDLEGKVNSPVLLYQILLCSVPVVAVLAVMYIITQDLGGMPSVHTAYAYSCLQTVGDVWQLGRYKVHSFGSRLFGEGKCKQNHIHVV
jgi:hypothetical protein